MLYIPHSSDKTFSKEPTNLTSTPLYIPHSSDKTVEEPNVSEVWENFTSHIVQIKRARLGSYIPSLRTLHPT